VIVTQNRIKRIGPFELADYAGSKDYRHLVELARKASIICIVDYDVRDVGTFRDVGRTQYSLHHEEEVFQVGARGIGYIHAFGAAEFVALCEHRNVEFIPVPKSTSAV
jgi:hypothetical protein